MNKRKKKIAGYLFSVLFFILISVLGFYQEGILDNFKNEVNHTKEDSAVLEQRDNLLEVYFIDVGQADSILIKQGEQTALIDAGNNADGEMLVQFMQKKDIEKLNYLIGTHPHEDHIGGMDDVIRSFEIGQIYLPKIGTNTKSYEELLKTIEEKEKKVKSFQKGDKIFIGKAEMEVMTDSILEKKNLNLSSSILRLTYGEKSFLFTGDAEVENEKTRKWPKTNVLKVGHHGSTTSSSLTFLQQVKPEYSIISVGKDNDYGHPKQEIIKRLQQVGSNIYRTDELGTIQVQTDGKNIQIRNGEK